MDQNNFPFANRAQWDLAPNQINHFLDDLKASQTEILDLTQSNPTAASFSYPDQMVQALNDKKNLVYNPGPQGLKEARQVIAAYYKEKGIAVDIDNIFLTASTSEGYSFLFRLLFNPYEKILLPRPSYPLFTYLSELNDLAADYYFLRYNTGWDIDFNRFKDIYLGQVRAVVVVNPNNPTGSYINTTQLEELNGYAQKYHLALISDEVFFDYKFLDHQGVSFAGNQKSLTFTLGGLSKMLCLPQMKLSWIVISGPPSQVHQARQRLEGISDTYLSVNTPSQNALPNWFKMKDSIQAQVMGRLKANLESLRMKVTGVQGVELLNVEGGWYATLRLPGSLNEEQWVLKFLQKGHVSTHP